MGDELNMFAKKELLKEVIIPKAKNEALRLVIVESGRSSMIPTVVVANMMPNEPAARCGLLKIGNQVISVNGISMVGLPLSSCQEILNFFLYLK
jgi:C-terminal processing protease CtpA/Prc